jgi:hypothetical protein
VQVATDIGFTQILADDSTVTSTQFYPGTLPSRVSCFWRVRSKGTTGSSAYFPVQSFRTGSVTDVTPDPIPTGFVLRQNYPNPFNPSTAVPFEISSPAFVTLIVYDLLGREIQSLVSGQMSAGAHMVRWNGANENGEPVPSGMYLIRMTASSATMRGGFVATRKVMLLK